MIYEVTITRTEFFLVEAQCADEAVDSAFSYSGTSTDGELPTSQDAKAHGIQAWDYETVSHTVEEQQTKEEA
jgi:hypothetical protein